MYTIFLKSKITKIMSLLALSEPYINYFLSIRVKIFTTNDLFSSPKFIQITARLIKFSYFS